MDGNTLDTFKAHDVHFPASCTRYVPLHVGNIDNPNGYAMLASHYVFNKYHRRKGTGDTRSMKGSTFVQSAES